MGLVRIARAYGGDPWRAFFCGEEVAELGVRETLLRGWERRT